jgi:type III secretion protein R
VHYYQRSAMDFDSFSPGTILVAVVTVALVPYVAVMITAFTKLVVVFSLLRNALGLQQTPPNVVLNGLAIILSAYVMYPVGLQMAEQAGMSFDAASGNAGAPRFAGLSSAPKPGGKDDTADLSRLLERANKAKEPLREFLVKHSSDAEREFFLATAQRMLPEAKRAQLGKDDLIVIVPAFTTSELARAFQIGFIIFLPFLVIDLLVANVLQALGMMMLSPTTISLPFKLLLFVALDGWSKLVHGLLASY